MAGTGKRRKFRNGKFTVIFLLLALVCLFIIGKQELEIHRIRQEEAATRERIEELGRKKAALEKERKMLDDPRYIEKLARDGYNMVGKDEVPLFVIDPEHEKKEQRGQ